MSKIRRGTHSRVVYWIKILCLPAALMALMGLSGCPAKPLSPPVARIEPHVTVIHGDTLTDNYYWLRNREDQAVIQYLKDENAYTEAVMQPTKKMQKRLYREMLKRIKETDLSVPVKVDDYYYYSRTEEGQQYPIFCRKHGNLEAPEEILLDQNKLAAGRQYCSLGAYSISPDHKILAYSVDFSGSEEHTLFFKNLVANTLLADTIAKTSYGVEWSNDNQTVFYTTLDSIKRPDKLWRHCLGTPVAEDKMVFHEPDERYYLNLEKTRSRRYLLLTLGSQITSEVHFLDADNPTGQFSLIQPRQIGVEYYADHHGKQFFIYTNENARNFKLMTTSVETPAKKYWQEKLAHRPEVMIDGIDLFNRHLVVYERARGLRQIRVENLETGAVHQVEFPEPVYTCSPTGNEEYVTTTLRFNYTSLVTPRSVYDYDMESRQRELKKQDEVLGGYQPENYVSERVYARASDGQEIPISLVFRKGLIRDGSHPLYLYGYGAYGSSSEPRFSSNRLSLLDRGFVYAIAHVRGGGELGRQWYEDGKLLKKRNTFTDFIACAEHLIANQYTTAEKLVINGGSAGGLLVGAAVTMRPELFRVVIAEVPFVDVLNTMLDPTIPLTVIEYDEWGNPEQKNYYDYLKSYAPYENVRAVAYPHLLITAGLNDPRVAYWEPAKWAAKLRALKTDQNTLLLKTDMGKGHFAATGRYDYLKETAFEYAFVFKMLNIAE